MGMSPASNGQSRYGPVDEREAHATIQRALDIGVNFFDTAEAYGPFHNEELLGKALHGRRGEAVIASKFGFAIGAQGAISGMDGSPANARRAIDASLQRLGVETIDLWYLHRLDPAVPIEDTVGAMAEAVRAGKARFLGLSEVSAPTLERAHAVHPISALQSEYSLWERNIESGILPTARKLGVGIVAYSPLGRGFLTGRVSRAEEYGADDYRKSDPRFQGENYDANQFIAAAIAGIAAQKGVTPAQVALRWLLQQGPDIVPIPGTKQRAYLEQNARAAEMQLRAADIQSLSSAAPPGAARGARYAERLLKWVDR